MKVYDLKDVRKSLRNDEEAAKRKQTGDNASFPFWNLPENGTAVVRFLPDGNDENPYFWRERQVIKLPFGDDTTIQVPCLDMFPQLNMKDPILQHTRGWWDDPAKKDMARVYWKKRSYITQAFIVTSPVPEATPPTNPIRRLVLNKGLYSIVRALLFDEDVEDMPIDPVKGRDFEITKTKKAGTQYADYGTSKYKFKTRGLNEAELSAIEEYGLNDLNQYLGRVPDAEEIEVIKAMFHDSLAGKPFDVASYGQWYRPYGSPEPEATKTEHVEALKEPKKPKNAMEILSEISSRNSAKRA